MMTATKLLLQRKHLAAFEEDAAMHYLALMQTKQGQKRSPIPALLCPWVVTEVVFHPQRM